MATSGVYKSNITRNDVIETSLRLLGQLADGEQASAEATINGQSALNMIVKHLQAQGFHLWTYEEATLFLAEDQIQYEMSSTTTDHITDSYTQTALSADVASGTNVITIDDSTGIAVGDYIGISLTTSSIQWTTVDSLALPNITLTDNLTAAVEDGDRVYFYTSKSNRGLQITQARRQEYTSGNETTVAAFSRRDYYAQSDKTNTGKVTQFYYDPQRDVGLINVWAAPLDDADRMNFTYQRPMQIFDSGDDNMDLPQEWARALSFLLAVDLSYQYALPIEERDRLDLKSKELLSTLETYDQENTSVFFQPDTDGKNSGGYDYS